ncbi:unnamed protein product [Discosporangium mesarthrocarpum]
MQAKRWSDASGVAVRGYCPIRQVCWRYDVSEDLRGRMQWGISINVLELMAMAFTGWVVVLQLGDKPAEVGEPALMKRDILATVP